MAEYAIEIDGDEFKPIPESWLDHPMAVDAGAGEPRLYAVSAALRAGPLGRHRLLVTRYAHPDYQKVAQYTEAAMDGPSGDGYVPAALREAGETWDRSLVPHHGVEPRDVLRVEEIEHFRDLWASRVDSVSDAEKVVADGGGR